MQLFGGLFFVTTNMFMGNFFNSVLVFQSERPVFLREQANHMYRVFPYYISKLTADTPMLLITPMISTLIIYWTMGLARTVEQFFVCYIIQTLCALGAASFGYFLSSMFDSEATATSIAPLFIMPMLLFGGLFTNNVESPVYLRWIQYISPIRYCAEGLMTNEMKYDRYDIEESLMSFLGYDIGIMNVIGIFVALIVVTRIFAFISFKMMVKKFQ